VRFASADVSRSGILHGQACSPYPVLISHVIVTEKMEHVSLPPLLRRTRKKLAVVALVVLAGCAREPRRFGLGVPAPNPNGCYVFVYDRPDWQGAGVVLNGPARCRSWMDSLANQENWRNRIRSVDVGPAATVTVYTDAAFQGASRRLAPNSKHPRLDSEFPLGSNLSDSRARTRLRKRKDSVNTVLLMMSLAW
jgi:Beta/Gamma crystallin